MVRLVTSDLMVGWTQILQSGHWCRKNDQAYFYAGGGLVWDSQADAEYQETYDKASAMFQLFEQ